MDEEDHIEIASASELHAVILHFFEYQKAYGPSLRTQELEAAAIATAAITRIFPTDPLIDDILRLAVLSGSPRLVASLPMTQVETNALSGIDWQDHIQGHLCGGRDDRIAAASAALSRGLTIYTNLGLIFGQAQEDRAWWPLLEEIARKQPSFGNFMYPSNAAFTLGAPADLATFLRLQVEHFPDTAIESFEYAAQGRMPALLGLMCLLPIDASRILTTAIEEDLAGLVERLKSNHGRLEISGALGTLDEALGDMSAFSARVAEALPRLGRRAGHARRA